MCRRLQPMLSKVGDMHAQVELCTNNVVGHCPKNKTRKMQKRARPSSDGHEGLKTLPTHGQSAGKKQCNVSVCHDVDKVQACG